MLRPLPLVLLAAATALVSGRSLGAMSHRASPTRPGAAARTDTLDLVRLDTYRGHGITFTYPASWRYRHGGFYSTMTSPVIDLSSQPTRNPCTKHGCWFPVRHLRPGAVAVVWDEGGGLIDPSRPPTAGVHLHVLPHECRALGGGDEWTAQVVLRGGRIYDVLACFRGPDIATHEAEVRAMLGSAKRT